MAFDSRQQQDFSLLRSTPTGCGAHPASCPMDTGGSFPGAKQQECEANHSPSSSSETRNGGNIPTTRFLLLPDSCGFVDVERSLSRENGSAVYDCCWSSPAQSFLGPSTARLVTILYCLRFETPPTWRARFPYLYLQEPGGPVTPPGTGFALNGRLYSVAVS
jgi:hypothetical protein